MRSKHYEERHWTKRRDIAVRCFADCKPASAVARLRRWIAGDPLLLAELQMAGYRHGSRYFSPRQAGVIRRYLL